MDKFTENLAGGIRRFAMVGVGAVSVTIEKSKELIDHLATRGETAAAETQTACDDLQKKMTAQLDSFSRKLKADYENASFDSLLKKCDALTPEQKEALISHLTAAPAEEPEETKEEGQEEAAECSEEEPSETTENETDNSASDEGFESTNVQENAESASETCSADFIDSPEEICPDTAKGNAPSSSDE